MAVKYLILPDFTKQTDKTIKQAVASLQLTCDTIPLI